MDCYWAERLPHVLTTTHPVRYMWNQHQFMLNRATAAIGLVVKLIGMITGAFGAGLVSGFAIELRHQVKPI